MSLWRVGSHYKVHVYEGERPVATFLREDDAAAAVAAHNTLHGFGDGRVLAVLQLPMEARAFAALGQALARGYGEDVRLAGIGHERVAVLRPREIQDVPAPPQED